MKVLTLKIGETVYTTTRITAYLSREAMKINTESLKLAKEARKIGEIDKDNMTDNDIDKVQGMMDQLEKISERKAILICQIYGNKFDMNTLEKELTTEEIDNEINRIISGINGIVEKNG